MCRRDGDGLVQVGALDDLDAGDVFLRLGERTVGPQRPAVAHPHRDGLGRRPQQRADAGRAA
jgi:hypothetical protein